MNCETSFRNNRTILSIGTIIWILAALHPAFRIWFDWETVRFFVIPRPGQYRWLEPLWSGWVDLGDYGVTAASQTLRPLMTWSFQLDSLIFGSWSPGYHLLNVLAHLICTGLLIHLLRRHGINPVIAQLSGLLFALHPLVTQPLWILGDRAEEFVLMGGLIALTSYPRHPGIAITGLLIGLASKETAITIPGWLLVYDFMFLERLAPIRISIKHRLRRITTPVIITLIYVIYRSLVFSGLGGYHSINHTRFDHFADVFVQNAAWLLSLPHHHTAITAAFLTGLTICFFFATNRISRFACIWFLIYLLPIHNLCNKWYLYTPLAACTVACAGLLDGLYRKRSLQRPLALLLLLTISILSILSYAELRHQGRNSRITVTLAERVHALQPELAPGTCVQFILKPPLSSRSLKGHYFDPQTFQLKSNKTPLESIVWDLNSTRYTPDLKPVWTRSVEAALQLRYDDITIQATLSDFPASPLKTNCFQVIYNPNAGSLIPETR